jgi:hypothetical protein
LLEDLSPKVSSRPADDVFEFEATQRAFPAVVTSLMFQDAPLIQTFADSPVIIVSQILAPVSADDVDMVLSGGATFPLDVPLNSSFEAASSLCHASQQIHSFAGWENSAILAVAPTHSPVSLYDVDAMSAAGSAAEFEYLQRSPQQGIPSPAEGIPSPAEGIPSSAESEGSPSPMESEADFDSASVLSEGSSTSSRSSFSLPFGRGYLQESLASKAPRGGRCSGSFPDPTRTGEESGFPPRSRREKKKAQNVAAALRYRVKKRGEKGEVGTEVEQLEARNATLKGRAAELTREIEYLRGLLEEIRAP